MNAPIVVSERGDITVFDTMEAAEKYLEAPDVENFEYEIFDSVGNVLYASVEVVRGKRIFGLLGGSSKVVKILASSSGACDKDRLRELLTHFLQTPASESIANEVLSLPELIAKARQSR